MKMSLNLEQLSRPKLAPLATILLERLAPTESGEVELAQTRIRYRATGWIAAAVARKCEDPAQPPISDG
jgi:hypothetical protein